MIQLLHPDGKWSKPARLGLWLLIVLVIIILDALTKQWVSNALELYRPKPLLPWLNLTLAHNYGAAFSILSDQSGWQRWVISGLVTVVSLFIAVWLVRLPPEERLSGIALSMILGGALGNLKDRLQMGYVVDFVDVYWGRWHFPAFNVADSAISVGFVLLLIDSFLLSRRQAAS